MNRHYAPPVRKPFRLLLLFTPFILLCTYCGWQESALSEVTPFPLTQARAITFSDAWTGLSPMAPIGARYTMRRSADAFEGNAHFYAAGYSDNPREAEEEVSIPLDVVTRFLEMLEQTPMRPGTYEPLITHTDDYPSLSIKIALEADTVAIFSGSQGV